MPLLVHGEVADQSVDLFDREAVYIERVLDPMRRDFPGLRVVLEHVTTADAVDYVRAADRGLGATITPHHLTINRNAIFRGGIRPHMYCLPVAKRERHRLALRAAAVSGDSRFFLGTDSAPHPRRDKETDCGCAGIFNAPNALQCVAQVFDEEDRARPARRFRGARGRRILRNGAEFRPHRPRKRSSFRGVAGGGGGRGPCDQGVRARHADLLEDRFRPQMSPPGACAKARDGRSGCCRRRSRMRR